MRTTTNICIYYNIQSTNNTKICDLTYYLLFRYTKIKSLILISHTLSCGMLCVVVAKNLFNLSVHPISIHRFVSLSYASHERTTTAIIVTSASSSYSWIFFFTTFVSISVRYYTKNQNGRNKCERRDDSLVLRHNIFSLLSKLCCLCM